MANVNEDHQDVSVQFDDLVMLVYGGLKSQILFAACKLGIFELLSLGPSNAEAISEKISANQAAMTQLLDALVSLKLLEKHSDEKSFCYSNAEAAQRFLVKSSPDSIKGYVLHVDQLSKVHANLTFAVCEGGNQWRRTLVDTSSDSNPFNFFYATKEKRISFLDAMKATIKQDHALQCVSAFNLLEFNHMCDLGGCTGDLAYVACQEYPKMKITVLDLPCIVELSPHFRPSIEECPNQENVSFLAADFFADDLPSVDLYVLTRILHDWDDDKVNLLLSKIFKSLPSGGGILIGEMLLRDDKTGPLLANLFSLHMLTVAGDAARERSGLEYKDLLETNGFVQVQTKVTQSIFLDAVFARKP